MKPITKLSVSGMPWKFHYESAPSTVSISMSRTIVSGTRQNISIINSSLDTDAYLMSKAPILYENSYNLITAAEKMIANVRALGNPYVEDFLKQVKCSKETLDDISDYSDRASLRQADF